MTEEEARERIASTVPRETFLKLEEFAALLDRERHRQNLISERSAGSIWQRHLLDSAQLCWFESAPSGLWLDIGSGAGLPGLVVAILRPEPVALVEPRARRVSFLRDAITHLGLSARANVIGSRIETAEIGDKAAIVSARAVASLDALFSMSQRHVTPDTLWLLPKGQSAAAEVAEARLTWQGEMRLVPSLSEPTASIVVARDIRRKTAR